MKLLALVLASLPSVALADFDCHLDRQCGGGACDGLDAAMLLHQAGDVWQVTMGSDSWEGYDATTVDQGGSVSIVIPPQNGMGGLITVDPSGQVVFTAHALANGELVALTGSGNCAGEGG